MTRKYTMGCTAIVVLVKSLVHYGVRLDFKVNTKDGVHTLRTQFSLSCKIPNFCVERSPRATECGH